MTGPLESAREDFEVLPEGTSRTKRCDYYNGKVAWFLASGKEGRPETETEKGPLPPSFGLFIILFLFSPRRRKCVTHDDRETCPNLLTWCVFFSLTGR